MKVFRQHIISKLLWVMLAAHIFNCSVDTRDAQPDYVSEDLSFNDMESVLEILLENVLHIENAIAEHDENDSEEGTSFNLKKDFSFHKRNGIEKIKFLNIGHCIPYSFHYKEHLFSQFLPEIVPPPPKV